MPVSEIPFINYTTISIVANAVRRALKNIINAQMFQASKFISTGIDIAGVFILLILIGL